jgi:homogentisate 1,2-dioxygenase
VTHEPFHPRDPAHKRLVSDFTGSGVASVTPTQLRWKPPPIPEARTNFIDGLFTVCGAGSPFLRHGFAVHMYIANASMEGHAFANADGDFLIVPQQGSKLLTIIAFLFLC